MANEIESVATATIKEAPADANDLVKKATARAAVEAITATFGADIAENSKDAEYLTEVSRVFAENRAEKTH